MDQGRETTVVGPRSSRIGLWKVVFGNCAEAGAQRKLDQLVMDAINETRLGVWQKQPPEFLTETACIDADGSLVSTTGECKEGMDISYKGIWGYHPLLVSFANTGVPSLKTACHPTCLLDQWFVRKRPKISVRTEPETEPETETEEIEVVSDSVDTQPSHLPLETSFVMARNLLSPNT